MMSLMTSAELLVDGFGRVAEDVHGAVSELTEEELTVRLDPGANSIAWLVWHLTRIQDDHIADAFGTSQVWPAWAARFSVPFDLADTGYAHDNASVGLVRAEGSLLAEYFDAVQAATLPLVSDVTDPDLDRVVDRRWTPPVTLGVRLVSVLNDATQHAGQAAFIRGILLRRR
jgi:uncharacterized damage-inducible protein DinB